MNTNDVTYKILDTLYRIGRYRNDLSIDSVYNTVAALAIARYRGEVVVTKGNYIGPRETVVCGTVQEVLDKLDSMPTLAAETVDPNGLHAVPQRVGAAVEVFATLYHGEK